MNLLRRVTPFALALPPLIALAWVAVLGRVTPEPAEWLLLRADQQLVFEWEQVFDFGDRPAFLAQRVLYLLLLSLPGVDLVVAHFVPWILTVACCLLFWRLLFRLSDSPWRGLGLLLFVGYAFSPVFGANWLLAARFRVVVPVLCFLGSVLLLSRERGGAAALHGSLWLALLAVFTEKSGVLLWPALVPLVLHDARRRGVERPLQTVAWWTLLGSFASVLCFVGLRTGARHFGLLGRLVTEPLATLRYAIDVIGKPVPEIVAHPMTPILVALLLLVGFAWLLVRARRHREAVDAQLPTAIWTSVALFGLGVPLLAVEWHLGTTVADSWLRELLFPGCFFPIGVAGLCAVHAPRVAGRAFPILLVLMFVALALDWQRGWEHLKIVRSVLGSAEAQLVVFESAGSKMDPARFPPVTRATAGLLRERGELGALPQMGEPRLDLFDMEPEDRLSGEFRSATADGATGVVLARTLAPPPSLVVLTRFRGQDAEEVIRITTPNFYGGGGEFPWRVAWPTDDALESGDEVRSYAFHVDGLRLVRLPGAFRRTAAGFEAVRPERGGR